MSPLTLESELKRAANPANWMRVVHRCAWCQRVANGDGEYVATAEVDEASVVTDGMCPDCGARALAVLTTRQLRRV